MGKKQTAIELRENDPPEDYLWRTRDGVEMKLGDMRDSHLLNTLRMLLRNMKTDGARGYMIDKQTATYVRALRAIADKRGLLIEGRVPTYAEQEQMAERLENTINMEQVSRDTWSPEPE